MYSAELNIKDASQLPKPQGYKVMVAIPAIQEKTAGGIIRPDILKGQEQTASIFGCVIAMGDRAYEEDKFPTPYCKVGDWVLFKSYSGVRFRLNGQEFRLINDDSVEATIDDPTKIERV